MNEQPVVRRPATRPRTTARPTPPPRDPRPFVYAGGAALLLIVLALLFVGPCAPFNPSDDGGDANVFECKEINDLPALPGGLEQSSDYRDYASCNRDVPAGAATLTIPLREDRVGRALGFYTRTDQGWQRLAAAELTEDGKSARVTVERVPANGVVLRRAPGAFQIMGVTPQGGVLSLEAERVANVVGGADFVPAADGAINGGVTNLKRNEAALLVPVVRAAEGSEAEAVNAVLGSADRRGSHAENLARLVQSNKVDGVELEYTAVNRERRDDFTDLVRQAGEAVHKIGGVLIVTLPVPQRSGESWNTGAYNWAELAKSADYLKIAPLRDQAEYRRIMPEALTYLTKEVDPKKLVLTIPALSVEKSDAGLRTLSTLDALSIAAQMTIRDRDRAAAGSEITFVADNLAAEGGAAEGLNWDAITATVAYTYRAENGQRTVWIENQFSAAFKTEFVRLWKLGGVAVDDASNNAGLSSIWPAIAPLAEDGQLTPQQPNSNLLRPEWLVDNSRLQAGRATATWRAPNDPGTHSVTVIVSDGVMRVANTQRFTLRPAGAVTATPTPTARPGGSAVPTATPTVRR